MRRLIKMQPRLDSRVSPGEQQGSACAKGQRAQLLNYSNGTAHSLFGVLTF